MPLYTYQLDYLRGLPKNAIMTADTGLGKGQLSLEHYKRYNHTPEREILVVAPASKVREGGWLREFELADLPPAPVISYERLSKDFAKYADNPHLTVIFDEGHYIANATALRSKAAIKVARSARQWIILTATPLPNGWRSGATYAVLTGLARNKTDYFKRFVIIDRSRGFPIYMGYREEDVLKKWWFTISRPLARTGDLKLPSQMIPVTIQMSAKSSAAYKKAVKERVTMDGDWLDSPSKLFTHLRQIPLTDRIHELHAILEGTSEHVVVFYNFNSEREAILALLTRHFKERPVYEQSGHRSHLPERKRWGIMSDPTVTIVQYQSGSQAIELTYASITVYFSPPTSYANYQQSVGRTKRNGQQRTTLFYHFRVDQTVDRSIWSTLKQRKSFSTELMRKTIDNL